MLPLILVCCLNGSSFLYAISLMISLPSQSRTHDSPAPKTCFFLPFLFPCALCSQTMFMVPKSRLRSTLDVFLIAFGSENTGRGSWATGHSVSGCTWSIECCCPFVQKNVRPRDHGLHNTCLRLLCTRPRFPSMDIMAGFPTATLATVLYELSTPGTADNQLFTPSGLGRAA